MVFVLQYLEYLTTPEKIKHTITMWVRCAGELETEKKKRKKILFQDSTDVKCTYHKINIG